MKRYADIGVGGNSKGRDKRENQWIFNLKKTKARMRASVSVSIMLAMYKIRIYIYIGIACEKGKFKKLLFWIIQSYFFESRFILNLTHVPRGLLKT